jgi:branched-chain amino acid transport system substrate-binding protein
MGPGYDRRQLLGLAAGAALVPAFAGRALAQAGAQGTTQAGAGGSIKVGALTDLSGPYRDIEGPTGTICAQQAIAEFTAANPGIRIELLQADHQNKPDVGAQIVRQWFDRDAVDVLIQVGNTAVALAVNTVARDKDKVHINTGALSSVLTGQYCSPNLVHGPLDTWAMSHSTATGIPRQGGDRWFFLTADYTYGHALQDDAATFLKAAGGTVVGSAAYPFPGTTDFSSFLLQAQASGANVLALASSGTDVVNQVKQAKEFGVSNAMRIVGLGAFLQDVMATEPAAAAGLLVTESFYWDLNDRTRAFYGRVKPKLPAGVFPSSLQAGAYAGMTHYLKAVRQMGVAEAKRSGARTVEVMKSIPTDDDAFGPGTLRADGQMIAPIPLFQVKPAAERTQPGQVYTVVSTTPAEQAFRPLSESACPLVRKG